MTDTSSSPGPGLAARIQAALGPQYELGAELGRGGMGVVFLARDVTLDREVAVKAVHPELAIHPAIAQRFLAEARMIARLRHPNIVTVHAAGEVSDLLYYVMDRVPGESVRERLNRDQRIPPEEARRITADIAAALGAAGRAGLVHRDVKPENILIEAGTGRALLADFGIARALVQETTGSVTGQGMVVGTPNYMSPEQAAGEEVDSRSDLYALGVVAYEMIAGHPPFAGPSRVVVSKHISERPQHLARVRPETPADLADAIMRALEKSPDARYQTGDEFRAALGGTPTPVPVPFHRARRGVFAIAAALLLVLAGGIFALRGEPGPPNGTDPRHSVLILPFDNLRDDPNVEWMRDGSVNMLGLNMSQWNDLRVVEHERVHDLLTRHKLTVGDDIGLDMARRMAREAGVWTVVLGDFALLGDSLHLTARVFDVASGKRVDVAEVHTLAGEDARASFDLLAARLLDLSGAPGEVQTGLARVTTPSLEAYRAYLAGEDRLNRWDLGRAQAEFERAVAIDTTFGLAYFKLALTRGWIVGIQDSLGQRSIDRAMLYSQSLPAHDRAMIGAYRTFLRGQNAAARNIYEQLLAKDAQNADAWYGLGDAWFHDTAGTPARNRTQSLRAFRRALELEPDYALAYEHVQMMLSEAGRTQPFLLLVTPDSFASNQNRDGSPRLDSAAAAPAVARARAAELESARAWSTAQPATLRAHLAMVDALLASGQYDEALAEAARFRAADPDNPEAPFIEARIRFASGDSERAATELSGALDSLTAQDFARNLDAPTVVGHLLAGVNVFAYRGDLNGAARVIELADRVRREVLPGMTPMMMQGEDWKRGFQGDLYASAGVPVTVLRRIWEAAAEEARSEPADKRKETLSHGAAAALGLFVGPAADPRPLQELQAMIGEPAPRELRALLAIAERDTARARRTLAEPDSAVRKYGWGSLRPLYAQAQFLLGDYAGTIETLRLFEPSQFSTRGFDSRWGMLGRVRLLRGAAFEKLGRRTEAEREYADALAQWKDADPELGVFVRQAEAGLARVRGRG